MLHIFGRHFDPDATHPYNAEDMYDYLLGPRSKTSRLLATTDVMN